MINTMEDMLEAVQKLIEDPVWKPIRGKQKDSYAAVHLLEARSDLRRAAKKITKRLDNEKTVDAPTKQGVPD